MEQPIPDDDEIKENRLKDKRVLEEEARINAEIYDENGYRIKTNTVYTICVLICIGGWLLQPLYILFYVTYGMLEFYRRVEFIFFYASMGGGGGGGAGGF